MAPIALHLSQRMGVEARPAVHKGAIHLRHELTQVVLSEKEESRQPHRSRIRI